LSSASGQTVVRLGPGRFAASPRGRW
jgi:hypothetical protein